MGMNYPNFRQLFRRIRKKRLTVEHVAEVGVFHPETSNIFDFICEGRRTTLVEPNPECVGRIKALWGDRPNVTVYPNAIYAKRGPVKLVQREASTFVAEIPETPALVNDRYVLDEKDTFSAESIPFSDIDDGTIDVLSVDIEGAEWFVIKDLVSRPRVISVETHGKYYLNPYLKELREWFSANGYRLWYKTKSDSVYVRAGSFRIGVGEKIRLAKTEVYLWLRRKRKIFRWRP